MELAIVIVMLLALLALVLWLAFSHGQAVEKQSETTDKLKAVGDAKKIEDDIAKLSDADVSKRLSKWWRGGVLPSQQSNKD